MHTGSGETRTEWPMDKSSGSSTLHPNKNERADLNTSSGADGKENTLHSPRNGELCTALQGSFTKDSSSASSGSTGNSGDDDSSQKSDFIEDTTSSSDDDVPRTKQPEPTSPPNPSKPVNTKDTVPSHPRYVSKNGVAISPPPNVYLTSKLTQTEQTPVCLPHPITDHLVQPDLSFPDTISERPTKSSGRLHSIPEGPNGLKPSLPKHKSKILINVIYI